MDMNAKQMTKSLVGGLVLAIGFVLAAETPALAQRDRHYDNYYGGVRWDSERERRYAYLLGYHTAYSEGRDTRFSRVRYNDMPGYREGTNGWRDWMGSQNTYRDHYRRGYRDGFTDARGGRARRYDRDDVEQVLGDSLRDVYEDDDRDFRRFPGRDRDRRDDRFDRNDVFQIAQRNGYRDGFNHGREDLNRRRGYDFDDNSLFRNATNGYQSQYRDVEAYRRGYREGFQRGYDDGYRRRASNDPRFRRPF
jgi:hypothetical protein